MANPSSPRWLLALVLLFGVVAVAGFVALLRFPGPSVDVLDRVGMGDAAERLAEGVAELTDAAIEPVRSQIGIAGEPAAPNEPTTVGDVLLPARTRKPMPAAAPLETRESQDVETIVVAAEPPLILPEPEPEPPIVDEHVYTSGDAGVVPPRPLQALFPTNPPFGVDAASLGVVEFVVNQAGYVEVVDLVRPSDNVLDGMLLAAIKAWRFEPAYKDGLPVKFRQTIRLTH